MLLQDASRTRRVCMQRVRADGAARSTDGVPASPSPPRPGTCATRRLSAANASRAASSTAARAAAGPAPSAMPAGVARGQVNTLTAGQRERRAKRHCAQWSWRVRERSCVESDVLGTVIVIQLTCTAINPAPICCGCRVPVAGACCQTHYCIASCLTGIMSDFTFPVLPTVSAQPKQVWSGTSPAPGAERLSFHAGSVPGWDGCASSARASRPLALRHRGVH